MIASFYIVDEADFPASDPSWQTQPDPVHIIDRIRAKGGAWGDATVTIDQYLAVFELLETLGQAPDFFRNLAIAGSPGLVLSTAPGPWRLGYFEASLVPAIAGILRGQPDEVEAGSDALDEDADALFTAFQDALFEAEERGFALAIVHN